MISKILVALDRTGAGMQVFQQALELARATGANLMLVHVLSSDDMGYPNFPPVPGIDTFFPAPQSESAIKAYVQQWQDYEQEGSAWLRSRAAEASAVGIAAEYSQLMGTVGRTICELASNWGAELIVMGRRGRTGLSELILGSVSNYVTHHAPCSVLTLKLNLVNAS